MGCEKLEKILDYNNVTGLRFDELSLEEMESIQGSGDVNPEITPTVTLTWYTIGVGGGVVLSVFKC